MNDENGVVINSNKIFFLEMKTFVLTVKTPNLHCYHMDVSLTIEDIIKWI